MLKQIWFETENEAFQFMDQLKYNPDVFDISSYIDNHGYLVRYYIN